MTPDQLRAKRETLGLSLDQVVAHMARRLPDRYTPTKTLLWRLEHAVTPIQSVDTITLAVLAAVLDTTLSELAPDVYIDLTAVLDELVRSRCDAMRMLVA